MKAIHLKAEHMVNPIGLEASAPVLSWVLDRGEKQTAYRVLASVSGDIVWDSGKVESSAMLVQCGYTAKARERVEWLVEVWDENDEMERSEQAYYEIGLIDRSWSAKWIDPEKEHDKEVRQPSSVLRKTFSMENPVSSRKRAFTPARRSISQITALNMSCWTARPFTSRARCMPQNARST